MNGDLSVGEALRTAAAHLAAGSDTPRLDAELLMAHALGLTRDALLLGDTHRPVPDAFARLIARRVAHEPVAYITGTRDFWTLTLQVTPAVLIPRPDSETLIEAAIAHFSGTPGPTRILDLGTGSGALLLAALDHWPAAIGVGVDRSKAALVVAAANAWRMDCTHRARFVEGGWDAVAGGHDLVLCNPPYIAEDAMLPPDVIEHEPHEALFAGSDGLDAYRALAPLLPTLLAPEGVACVEIGATQAVAVAALFAEQGLAATLRRDLAGLDRCLVATAHIPLEEPAARPYMSEMERGHADMRSPSPDP